MHTRTHLYPVPPATPGLTALGFRRLLARVGAGAGKARGDLSAVGSYGLEKSESGQGGVEGARRRRFYSCFAK
jgi:hypothetical protein